MFFISKNALKLKIKEFVNLSLHFIYTIIFHMYMYIYYYYRDQLVTIKVVM